MTVNSNYNVKVRRPSYNILSGKCREHKIKYTYQVENPLTQPAYLHTIAV